MKARISRVMFSVLLVAVSLCAVATPRKALGQQQTVVERLFRSVLTSVIPLYASGQEGDPNALVGLRTESTVFEINEPIEKGLIPKPQVSGAEPIGRMVGHLRCMDGGRVDKSKPMQIFVGTVTFRGRAMKFEAKGTSIVHWCRGDNGAYNGVRWTDFSGAVTNIEGRHAGAKGHLVGTRLLVGDPDLKGQSGLIILRLVD